MPEKYNGPKRRKSDLSNGGWKTIAVILITAFIAGFGSFVVFGLDKPTRAEVGELIGERSPYMRDKGMIEAKFEGIEKRLERIEKKLDEALK